MIYGITATLAQGRNQSARMSGKSFGPGVRATGLNLKASTTPDSLIPSRIAALTTAYSTQAVTSVPSAATANKNTVALAIAACISSPPVPPLYQPTACTPPAENSEAPGASGAEDGQGVCTLTIDTGALGKTWLPAYVLELRQLDLARKLHVSAHRRRVKDTLSYSGLSGLAEAELRETVLAIRHRGGLLLIGGVQ